MTVLMRPFWISPSTINAPPSTATARRIGARDGVYRRWRRRVEATAFALQALLAIDPTNKLVEPGELVCQKPSRGAVEQHRATPPSSCWR